MDGDDSENDGWRRETMDDEEMQGSHEEYESKDL